MKTGDFSYILTVEGKSAVLEAIEFLQSRINKSIVGEDLIWSDTAANLCSFHCDRGAQDPDNTGLIPSEDHNDFKILFQEEFGGEEKVGGHAECHEYGSADALEVILTLIIDDGNETRSNRNHLFGNWDYVGLSSKTNPKFKQMTSVVFIVAEDTVQQELSAAIEVAEDILAIKEIDWSKKKVGVSLDTKGFITVNFTLTMRDGRDKVLTHKMASNHRV